jgi:hypothetical protein
MMPDIFPKPEWESFTQCRCGYDLQWLPLRGRCPECGALIMETSWWMLWNSDFYWLKTLRRGLVWLTFGYLIVGSVSIAEFCLLDFMDYPKPQLTWCIPSVVVWIGSWNLGKPDPASLNRVWDSGVGLRIAATLNVAATVIFVLYSAGWNYGIWVNRAEDLSIFIWLLWTGMLFLRLRYLARRMGSRGLSFWCATIWLAIATTSVLAAIPYATYFNTGIYLDGWLGEVLDALDAWKFLPIAVGFLMLVIYWGLINMALRRISFQVRGRLQREPGEAILRFSYGHWRRLSEDAMKA